MKSYHFAYRRYARMMLRRYPKMRREILGFNCLPRKQRNLLWQELLEKGIAAFRNVAHGRNADIRAWRKKRTQKGLQACWKRGARKKARRW